MSQQRQGHERKCKKHKILRVYRKQKNAVLISHRMGPNNLAVKWWRDQGDKADG